MYKGMRNSTIYGQFTANANGNYALCNIPVNTHAWRHPGQANPGFVCAKLMAKTFQGTLGAKNGAPPRSWNFQVARLTDKSGKFADGMIAKCAEIGMKPVCDHPSYCAKDSAAVYLGQDHHIG